MAWLLLTRINGQKIPVNMDMVTHVEQEPGKHSYLFFGTDDADSPSSALSVREAPEQIFQLAGVVVTAAAEENKK
jgi:hypothetical protein